jgi:hypothetical protein
MLLPTVLTLAGGLLGSVGWCPDDPRSVSWDLPPLVGRMLASAGWAFGIMFHVSAALLVLERPLA